MSSIAFVRRTLPALAILALAGCGDGTGPTPPPPAPNFVELESDAGDYIGGGVSRSYTQENAEITVTAFAGGLHVEIDGDERWNGTFQTPNDSILEKGVYPGVTRYPFHDPEVGGLDWSGEGRGCNMLTGTFTIDAVQYKGDTLKAIDLRFEQHCEGGSAALRGTIHWRADDTTVPPGPMAIPGELWQPASGTTPVTGDYVYLESEAGDWVGGGATSLLTEPAATITVNAASGGVFISAGGWSGQFVPMTSISRLQPGYYPGVQRWPFHNPVKGGMSWSGNGRGCNTLTGWFSVDSITYSAGEITALVLRFEQHCEGGTPALRGKVRWSA